MNELASTDTSAVATYIGPWYLTSVSTFPRGFSLVVDNRDVTYGLVYDHSVLRSATRELEFLIIGHTPLALYTCT